MQIKSENITSFGGIFPIMDAFDRVLSKTIDSNHQMGLAVEQLKISTFSNDLNSLYYLYSTVQVRINNSQHIQLDINTILNRHSVISIYIFLSWYCQLSEKQLPLQKKTQNLLLFVLFYYPLVWRS